MKYVVDLDGRRFEVELEGDRARVDGGAERTARLTALPGSPVRLVTLGEESREVHRVVARRDGERGRYVLRVNGRRYLVEALDERARAIRDLAGSVIPVAGPQQLLAPMPGLVVRVRVKPGDHVDTGQGIVVIEAMKMENELRAPRGGIVRSVAAQVGSAVEKGAMLVEIEPTPRLGGDPVVDTP